MKKTFVVRGVPIELRGKSGSAKLWDFEFSCGIRNSAQGITIKEFGIQFVESRIHSVEYRILDFFRINLLRAILDFYFPGER